MDRFVVFVRDDQSQGSAEQIDVWTKALVSKSPLWIEVCHEEGLRAYVLQGRDGLVRHFTGSDGSGRGLVIGTLFERGQGRKGPVTTLAAQDVRCLSGGVESSSGRSFWGDFTAIWHSSQNQTIDVYRDPCGSTSCFRLRTGGIDLLFSHLSDLVTLPCIALTIDWTSIQAFLVHNYFITDHTGFREIREVLPGEQIVCRSDARPISRWPWNAAEMATVVRHRSFEEAIEDLQAVATDCFAAWGTISGDVAVRLSGGLDSTVVTQLIRQASRRRVVALHVRGTGYEAQDLAFARIAAEYAGVELIELDAPDTIFDLSILTQSPLLSRPCSQLLGAAVDAVMADACTSLSVHSIMSGHGGDSLFVQRGIAADAPVDYVRLNGFDHGFARTVYESASLQEVSIWSVFSRLSAHVLLRKKWTPYHNLLASRRSRDVSSADGLVEQLPSGYVLHPCLRDISRLPPCKALQVTGILALRNYHSQLRLGMDLDALEPLTSQPLVELCLQTPTYLFNQGAIDRAMQRRAFETVLPPKIARRFQKGFVNHQILNDLAKNIDTIREFLFEGELLAQGVTTRTRIADMLGDEEILRGQSLPQILDLLAAEIWLASFKEHGNGGRRVQ